MRNGARPNRRAFSFYYMPRQQPGEVHRLAAPHRSAATRSPPPRPDAPKRKLPAGVQSSDQGVT